MAAKKKITPRPSAAPGPARQPLRQALRQAQGAEPFGHELRAEWQRRGTQGQAAPAGPAAPARPSLIRLIGSEILHHASLATAVVFLALTCFSITAVIQFRDDRNMGAIREPTGSVFLAAITITLFGSYWRQRHGGPPAAAPL